MRPVNLIPLDQRRGAAGAGTGVQAAVYGLLGVLALVLVGVLALVLTSNQVNSKKSKLASLNEQMQSAKSVADVLGPYGKFASAQKTRYDLVAEQARSRFPWERSLRQLSHAIPPNVWLSQLTGSVTGDTSGGSSSSGGASGASAASAAGAFTGAPAIQLDGCTVSQHAVARMMTSMRDLDYVTDVKLANSERATESGGGSSSGGTTAPAGGAAGAGGTGAGSQCDNKRLFKFTMTVVFGAAPSAQQSLAGAALQGLPTPVDRANGAVATSSAANAAAGGQTGQTGGGGK